MTEAELDISVPALRGPTGELEAALRAKSSFWEPEGENSVDSWWEEARHRMKKGDFVKAPNGMRAAEVSRLTEFGEKYAAVPESEQKRLVDRFVRGEYGLAEEGPAGEGLWKNRTYMGVEQQKFNKMINSIMSVTTSGAGGAAKGSKMVKRRNA